MRRMYSLNYLRIVCVLCRFGSKQIGNRTGILFNDEMKSFSDSGIINRVVYRKRPMSAMCPAIILNAQREVVLVIGASGGELIPSATAYVSLYRLMHKKQCDTSS